MPKKIAIVIAGDPSNTKFDYSRQVKRIEKMFTAANQMELARKVEFATATPDLYEVHLVSSAERGVELLKKEGGYVVFVSTHFYDEALRLQRKYGRRITFVVWSCGMRPDNLPLLLFRETQITEANLHSLFP